MERENLTTMQNDITKAIIQIAEASGLNINIHSADGGLLYHGCGVRKFGTIGTEEIEALKAKVKQKNTDSYFVLGLVADNTERLPELLLLLKEICETEDIVMQLYSDTIVYLKAVGKAKDYRSAGEFAYTLYDNLNSETKTKFRIGVGGVTSLIDEIPKTVENSITAYKFGGLIDPDSRVYSYKEYAFNKLLDSLPQKILTEHLKMLTEPDAIELFSDVKLMHTADVFLKNSLNLSETARVLYLHRNTLIYRLDKIEDMTGLNIRLFSDAIIFRMMVILNKLLGDRSNCNDDKN